MAMRRFRVWLLAAVVAPAMAAAQAPPKSEMPLRPKSEQLSGCTPTRGTVGQGSHEAEAPDGGNLSDKLAQSGGVLCPPAQVDPGIKVPSPPAGRMPVIPPPGSPGGDPNVQPK